MALGLSSVTSVRDLQRIQPSRRVRGPRRC